MLTDPVKFYEYFKIAHSQLQGTGANKSASNHQSDSAKSKEDKKEELKVSKKMTDFDDLTLFFLTMPHHLLEDRDDKV